MSKYVRPLVAFDRIPLKTVQQFALRISATTSDHMVRLELQGRRVKIFSRYSARVVNGIVSCLFEVKKGPPAQNY